MTDNGRAEDDLFVLGVEIGIHNAVPRLTDTEARAAAEAVMGYFARLDVEQRMEAMGMTPAVDHRGKPWVCHPNSLIKADRTGVFVCPAVAGDPPGQPVYVEVRS